MLVRTMPRVVPPAMTRLFRKERPKPPISNAWAYGSVVGWAGSHTGGLACSSCGVFTLDASIQKSGKSIVAAMSRKAASLAALFSHARLGACLAPTLGLCRGWARLICAPPVRRSQVPPLRVAQQPHHRAHGDHEEEEEDECHCARLAGQPELEGAAVHLERQHVRRVRRPALGEHVDRLEHLHGVDGGYHHHEEQRAAQERQGHKTRPLPCVRAVDERRLVERARDLREPGYVQHLVVADRLPDVEYDERK